MTTSEKKYTVVLVDDFSGKSLGLENVIFLDYVAEYESGWEVYYLDSLAELSDYQSELVGIQSLYPSFGALRIDDGNGAASYENYYGPGDILYSTDYSVDSVDDDPLYDYRWEIDADGDGDVEFYFTNDLDGLHNVPMAPELAQAGVNLASWGRFDDLDGATDYWDPFDLDSYYKVDADPTWDYWFINWEDDVDPIAQSESYVVVQNTAQNVVELNNGFDSTYEAHGDVVLRNLLSELSPEIISQTNFVLLDAWDEYLGDDDIWATDYLFENFEQNLSVAGLTAGDVDVISMSFASGNSLSGDVLQQVYTDLDTDIFRALPNDGKFARRYWDAYLEDVYASEVDIFHVGGTESQYAGYPDSIAYGEYFSSVFDSGGTGWYGTSFATPKVAGEALSFRVAIDASGISYNEISVAALGELFNQFRLTGEVPQGDITPPFLVGADPNPGATDVPIDAVFTIYMSEDVVFGSGVARLVDEDGVVVWEIPASAAVVDPRIVLDGSVITIAIGASLPLAYATTYTLEANAGFFLDLAGNPSPGYYDGTASNAYTFTTEELTEFLLPIDKQSYGGALPWALNVSAIVARHGNGAAVSIDFEAGRVWVDSNPALYQEFDVTDLKKVALWEFRGEQDADAYLNENYKFAAHQDALVQWTPGDDEYFLAPGWDNYVYLPPFNIGDLTASVIDGVLVYETEHGTTRVHNASTIIDSGGNDLIVGGQADEVLRATFGSAQAGDGFDEYRGGGGKDIYRFEIHPEWFNSNGLVYLSDYESGERIEVQYPDIDSTNFKDVVSVSYDPLSNQTTGGLAVNGYEVPTLFRLDGQWVLDDGGFGLNTTTWFPQTAFALYRPEDEAPIGYFVPEHGTLGQREVAVGGLPVGSAARTIQVDVRITDDGVSGGVLGSVVEWGNRIVGERFGLMVRGEGQVYFVGESADLMGSRLVNDGQWHTLTVTYDGVGTVSIYVDGELDIQSDHSLFAGAAQFSTLDTAATDLRIGGNGSTEQFWGETRSVQIWDGAYTADEIDAGLEAELSSAALVYSEVAAEVTAEDTAVSGYLRGVDVDGDVLSYSMVSDPAHGSLSLDSATGQYTYTPDANYYGEDSFTFKVNDGLLDSSVETVSFSVVSVNDTPIGYFVPEHGTLGQREVAVGGLPVGSAARTIQVDVRITDDGVSGGVLGSVVEWGNRIVGERFGLMVRGEGQVYFVGESADLMGSRLVNDGQWHTLTVTYDGVGTVSIYVDGELDIQSDHSLFAGAAQFSTLDTAATDLRIGGNGSTEQFWGETRSVQIWDGAYTADEIDAGLEAELSSAALVYSEVAAEVTAEDTAVSGYLRGVDVDGDVLSYSMVSDPAHGSLSLDSATGQYTYTPDANYYGEDSFTFKVNDGQIDSPDQTASIQISPLSTDPAFVFNAHYSEQDGVIYASVGWFGSVNGLETTIEAIGGVADGDGIVVDSFPTSSDWAGGATVFVGPDGKSSYVRYNMVGTDPEALTGDGYHFTVPFEIAPGVLDVEVSLFPGETKLGYVGEEELRVVGAEELPASVTFAVGSGVTIAGGEGLTGAEGTEDGVPRVVELTLTLDRAIVTSQTVDWSVVAAAGSDIDGSDFVGGVLPSGSVVFAPGQTSKTIAIEIAQDGLVERNEAFSVNFESVEGGLLFDGSSQTASIAGELVNDDKPTVSVVGDALTGAEGDTGTQTYEFKVVLDQAGFEASSVSWRLETDTVGGRGKASASDFSGVTAGVIEFAAGQTEQTVSIEIQGDVEKEGREAFAIALFGQSENLELGDALLEAQIKDDDGYDLSVGVKFWGGSAGNTRPLKDVDLGLLEFTSGPAYPGDFLVKTKDVKLNAAGGQAKSDVWATHDGMTSFAMDLEIGAGMEFALATRLPNGWTVTAEETSPGVMHVEGTYNTAWGAQTAPGVKVGEVTWVTPEAGGSQPFKVISAQASDGVNTVSQSDLEVLTQRLADKSDELGQVLNPSMAEGGYVVHADKDFIPTELNQWGLPQKGKELQAVDTADARAALLIARGAEGYSPESMIAADVNRDGKVDTFDARQILLMARGAETQTKMVDWVFVDSQADLSGVTRTSVKEGDQWEQGVKTYLDDDQSHELLAILLGDVTGNFKPEDPILA